MKFNGTYHALASGNWEDFVSEPEPYSTEFYVVIEGPEAIEVGKSDTFTANIFGGGGVYNFLWEWRVGSGPWQSKYSDPAFYFNIYDENYYFYDDEYKIDIDMLTNEDITLSVKIYQNFIYENPASAEIIIHPGTNITFSNKIENTEIYGKLILDEDKEDPINSGEARVLAFDDVTQRVIRTNELPFIVDFQNTEKTEKHSFWELGSSSNTTDVLNHPFLVDINTPSTLTSNFTSTFPANIRNLLEGAAISGGQVQLRDPWFYYKDQNDNWFQSDELKFYNSPFYIFNSTINTYGGVFLDQSGPPLWNPPYYSVKVDQEQTIPINGVNHQFYFTNWTGIDVQFEDANNNETGVVFGNANASAQAVLKGTQLSDYIYTYSQNGQRKFIRTPDGYLHTFYASMDGVWYERSTDTGQNWELLHSEYPPLDNVIFKDPSMSYYSTPSDVVHEVLTYAVDYLDPLEPAKNDVVCIRNFVDGVTSQYAAEISTTDPLNSTYLYYNPVVACAKNGNTLVVWQTIKDGVGKKLQYAYGHWNSNGVWQLYETDYISNSAIGSYNPTLCASVTSNPITFHLAWNEGNHIYNVTLTSDASNLLTISNKQLVSNGSGYPYNYNPSIVEVGNIARIAWRGSRYIDQQEQGTVEYKTVLKHLGNNTYKIFGNTTNSVSLTRDEDDADYFLAWSEFSSNSNKFVTNTNNFSIIYNFGVTGDYVKLSTGDGMDNISAMIYNTDNQPYSFTKSSSLTDIMIPLNKITSLSINTGREGGSLY